nr:hypothetical protein [Tanacetum cinerariifolium]
MKIFKKRIPTITGVTAFLQLQPHNPQECQRPCNYKLTETNEVEHSGEGQTHQQQLQLQLLEPISSIGNLG